MAKEFTDIKTSWLITSVFPDRTPAASVHLGISGEPFWRLEWLRLRWYHIILLLYYRTENSSYYFKHRRQIRYDQSLRKPNPKQKNLSYTLCVPGLSWPHLPLASVPKYIFSLGCLSSCLLWLSWRLIMKHGEIANMWFVWVYLFFCANKIGSFRRNTQAGVGFRQKTG